jgi:hypothetical protein
MNNYMASTIFNPENGQQGKAKLRSPADNDSFKRLFGRKEPQQGVVVGDLTDGQMTPRGKDHQKSSIIFNDAAKAASPVIVANGDSNGHVNEVVVVTTNGFTNGINNGHTTTNGHSPNNVHYNGGGSTGSISGPSSGPSSGSSTPNGSINGDYKSSNNYIHIPNLFKYHLIIIMFFSCRRLQRGHADYPVTSNSSWRIFIQALVIKSSTHL